MAAIQTAGDQEDGTPLSKALNEGLGQASHIHAASASMSMCGTP